jgi:hypothetical protein
LRSFVFCSNAAPTLPLLTLPLEHHAIGRKTSESWRR